MTLLPAIERETGSNPDAAIIWLHGLGADGNDFAPIVPALELPDELHVRFVFPHAPSIPVSINGGFVMPAWYDILEMEIDRRVDSEQLLISAERVSSLITRERERGISSKRIILAGFSQGGAVAYQCGLSLSHPLGGILAMSSYFATADSLVPHAANRGVPIAIHHGVYDPVVPESLGRRAFEKLEGLGYLVQYKNYPMEHAVCPEQISDISVWFQDCLL